MNPKTDTIRTFVAAVHQQGNQRHLNAAPKGPDPIDVIASVIADGRGADAAGVPRVGRQTRKKAKAVLDALDDAGWRILRK